MHITSSKANLFLSSYVWGAVADVKGRKPVVMLSCLLIGLFSAAFGFSIHLSMAIVFRFGVGLFNGKSWISFFFKYKFYSGILFHSF